MIAIGLIVIVLLVVLAICLACSDSCDWAQCGECSIWHNVRNGRTSFDIPTGWDGVKNDRLCPDCLGAGIERPINSAESEISNQS